MCCTSAQIKSSLNNDFKCRSIICNLIFALSLKILQQLKNKHSLMLLRSRNVFYISWRFHLKYKTESKSLSLSLSSSSSVGAIDDSLLLMLFWILTGLSVLGLFSQRYGLQPLTIALILRSIYHLGIGNTLILLGSLNVSSTTLPIYHLGTWGAHTDENSLITKFSFYLYIFSLSSTAQLTTTCL